MANKMSSNYSDMAKMEKEITKLIMNCVINLKSYTPTKHSTNRIDLMGGK